MGSINPFFLNFTSLFIQCIVLGTFVLILFDRKLSWERLVIFSFLNTAANVLPIQIVSRTAYSEVIFVGIYFLSMILLIRYILNLRFLYSILGTCVVFLLSTIVQYLVIAILKISLQGFDLFTWLAASPLNSFIMRLLGTFIDFLGVLVIYYFKIKIYMPADIYRKRKISIILNIFIIAMIIVPDILFFETTVIKIPSELVLFNAASAFVLLVLSTKNSIKFGELEMTKQELEFQKLYNKTLDDLTDNLRGFKHEFNNIISCIQGYLYVDDIKGLRTYVSQIQNEARTMNNMEPLNSYVKDNPAIYGLLLSKLSYSQVKNINFNIRVFSKIDPHNINVLDLCKMLGILLDNALEAAIESDKKYVEFMVKEDHSSNSLIIEISNSFTGNPDIEKIFEKGFSTKGVHKGFGLWELNRIIAKNHQNAKLTTNISGNLFNQRIEII
ncbi:sensor histidine kinase [Pseudobacteroides cellulosolvens]|uniref:Signal transduction histidine kinase regulating citrate/malate metabolism n=1 Tax=Pseudobacteroides cellulosolvens ATCC 35603 = DSM 2933 TaxID=398512 RepID=A0A0L6JVV4_9FIRM|nr:GHKL domain-containing protein [Pseudobacteroides cellulosolvens]KNY30001.1 signal transduction histidine kinase regulating citrate/malate metabolism [Pseudobacteroides cellulosolvens ATCC 35603 = DSM 2933]